MSSRRKRGRSASAGEKRSGKKGGKSRRGPSRREARADRRAGFFSALMSLAVVASLALGGALLHVSMTVPIPPFEAPAARSSAITILAGDGSVLAERGDRPRYVRLAEMPVHVIDAVLAIEDRRFYRHPGIDLIGTLRAALANARSGRTVQGGSTITQQLAKNLFLTADRTMARKLEEALLALSLELRLSKDQILELYLNRVYFGAGAYGIASASHLYFDKEPRQLSLAQSAMLAGLLQAPSRYAPTRSPDRAIDRSRAVLAAMAASGIITESEAASAMTEATGLVAAARGERLAGAGFLADWVLEQLPALIGTPTGAITIETTIDAAAERTAVAAVAAELGAVPGLARTGEAALVLMDNHGIVRAMVGGRSYRTSQFNRAVKARRQPGSAFKTFVYLAAVEAGMTADTRIDDGPITIDGWSPRNHDGIHRGPTRLREALARSVNTVAVRLASEIGLARVREVARRLGIESQLGRDASLALGTSEVTPLELARAYAVIASGGYAVEPAIVVRIRSADGAVLYERRPAAERRIVAAGPVAEMTDMLKAAVEAGTARAARLPGRAAAGKTGTTQGARDAWFVGFTGRYTAAVWVGRDDGAPLETITGGGVPARIWHRVMEAVLAGEPPLALAGEKAEETAASAIQAPLARTGSSGAAKPLPARVEATPPSGTAGRTVAAERSGGERSGGERSGGERTLEDILAETPAESRTDVAASPAAAGETGDRSALSALIGTLF
ncbi:MAG: PBP1A family penicillin-binding protein [Hyphomicrobiaceae bacterium]